MTGAPSIVGRSSFGGGPTDCSALVGITSVAGSAGDTLTLRRSMYCSRGDAGRRETVVSAGAGLLATALFLGRSAAALSACARAMASRSEEHTSELQSPMYL